MKSALNPFLKLASLLIMCGLLLSLNSCAKKFKFTKSTIVPAAEGIVTIKKDRNKNYEVKVEIDSLVEPEKLQPPRQMYIIWMLTDQNLTKNLGHIKTTESIISSAMNASFRTISSFEPVQIFLTAENDPKARSPTWDPVLSTETFKF